MKSKRKDPNLHTTQLNAGDVERVSTHCPPDMTESVKSALEAEIDAFKNNEEAQAKARKDASESAAGGAAVDAYQDWLERSGGHEPPEANPDIVSEADGIKYLHSTKDEESARLLAEFRQSLTTPQLRVWNLVMQKQMSLTEAGRLLRLKKPTVQLYLNEAKKKFFRFAEAMKDVRKS